MRDEYFGVAARDQFGEHVCRCGLGADAGGSCGVGSGGQRVGLGGVLIFVGELGTGGRVLAGPGVGGDGGRGRLIIVESITQARVA